MKRKKIITTAALSDIKRRIIITVLVGIITVIVGKIVDDILDKPIVECLGGVSKITYEQTKIPAVDYKTINVARGVLIRENLSSDTKEIIKESITVKDGEKIYITLTGMSKGRHINRRNVKQPGQVKVRVCVDEIEFAVDSDTFLGSETISLFSCATVCRELKPGEHNITVEGIFSGPLENVDAHLNCLVETVSKKKIRSRREQPKTP